MDHFSIGARVRLVKFEGPGAEWYSPPIGTRGTVIIREYNSKGHYLIRWDVMPPAGKQFTDTLSDEECREWFALQQNLELVEGD